MNPRYYQDEAHAAIYKAWAQYRRVLLVMATGCGKTIVFSRVACQELEAGRRVLILAHRDELIRQAVDKLEKSTGLSAAVEKAEETAAGSLYQITVGSVQTLMRPARLAQFAPDYYDLIIVDEAHHCLSDSYQTILQHFAGARCLGVTATPDRGDKRNLGAFFEDIAYEYDLRRAIKDGFLSKITAQTIPLKIDLGAVRVTAGDYNDADLGTALDPYLEQIAGHIPTDRKTLVFLPLIATSQKMTQLLQARGLAADHIDGTSPDRREKLARFTTGETMVLCNSMLLTEGYDEPSVSCIVCLRPTKIRSLYCQVIGRGTRIADGKPDLLVLDFLWHTARHDLCHPAHLMAPKAEIADAMVAIQDASGEQMDLEGLEVEAEAKVSHQREEALARALRDNQHRQRKSIDPLAFALSLHDRDLEDYEPVMPWQAAPPSDAQLATLSKFGFDAKAIPSNGFASMLMGKIFARQKARLATPGQVNLLRRYGIDAGNMENADAKRQIDRIAANGWRVA